MTADTGVYVYGILPAGVEVSDSAQGVGDPPGRLRTVSSDDLVALVSDVRTGNPLGTPQDLQAHMDILNATAADVPVLPMRFGAVVSDDDAVANELLGPNHDEFVAALEELEDRSQYVVKGRYSEQMILAEILSEDPEVASLAEQIRGADQDATRDLRIALGEKLNDAVAAKREQDTRQVGDALDGICAASVVREPTHERDAVHLACLVDKDKQAEFDKVIDDMGRRWEGRVELRLIGPMAAYDFVGTPGTD